MAKKYLHKKIATKPMSYQDILKVELDKYKHKVKFTLHEYMKQMPKELQDAYGMTSDHMRRLDCIIIALRNSSKRICAHLLIDKKLYLRTMKPSERDDLDYAIESTKQNFINPLERFIDGKEKA